MSSLITQTTVIVDKNGRPTAEFLRALNSRASSASYGEEVFQVQGGLTHESAPEVFQPGFLSGYELQANKDASGGYVGLTGYSINFKNAAGTFTSLLANTNTAIRTYSFPDRSVTVAGVDDITGGLQAANFTGYSASGTPGISATIDLATAATIEVTNGLITGQT